MNPLLRPAAWGGHLAMVLAVSAATALGFWQLHAWHERRAAAAVDLTHEKPTALAKVMGGDDAFPGDAVSKPVSFTGTWVGGSTVYIEGRRHSGRTGYWVVTPVSVDGTRSAMPVVRGWSATTDAPAVSGTTSVTGWLQPGEGEGLTDPHPDDDVLPELRIPSLVQHVHEDLYSGYVISRRPDADLAGVRPSQAPQVGGTTALRNFLYAIEWWVFGLFALVIWLRWCRDTLHPPPDEEVPEDEPAGDGSIGSGV